MDTNVIITIGREYGSGGHEIGKRLASDLGIDFYDSELIEMAANKTGYNKEYIKNNDEKAPDFTGSAFMTGMEYYHPSPADRIQEEVNSYIKEIGDKGRCVIVGRAADYILQNKKLIRVFVYAPFDDRVKRKLALLSPAEREQTTIEMMEKKVRQVDKQRRKFYDYYTDNKWGARETYDLLLNTSSAGIDGSVKIIETFIEECENASNMPD